MGMMKQQFSIALFGSGIHSGSHESNLSGCLLSEVDNVSGRLVMIDSPVVSVHIPPAFQGYAGGQSEITASGDTVAELLEPVCHEYSAICSHLMTQDGKLDSKFDLYLGGQSIADIDTPIDMQEVLSIVHTR
jgi:hypothetical protein